MNPDKYDVVLLAIGVCMIGVVWSPITAVGGLLLTGVALFAIPPTSGPVDRSEAPSSQKQRARLREIE